ncbi:MAG: hypothetical protein DLM56_14745 [Pseudonocardiales bacterium]|nr:MAG: hypothetical protein DLM56_14745 [Pseudonocardiales bacterium]
MNNPLPLIAFAGLNWSRRLRRQPRARLTQVVRLGGRGDLPATLNPRRAYQLGEPGKWAVLACPCGRGHVIELNLAHPDQARWRLSAGRGGLPSLAPSVDVRAERRCHFWLRGGRVRWV